MCRAGGEPSIWRRGAGCCKLGYLYPCRCSRKDLETALGAPHERVSVQGSLGGGKLDMEDDDPVYPGTCRRYLGNPSQLPGPTASGMEMPDGYNWRFRVPDGEAIEFVDRNLGPQRFVAGVDFGDFVVWRRDGVPSYQLACVADDAAMGITEVVRGADLLKSTARQMLLNRALGYRDPLWFHCRLVVDHNGRRLAKRHDSLSLRALRQRGLRQRRAGRPLSGGADEKRSDLNLMEVPRRSSSPFAGRQRVIGIDKPHIFDSEPNILLCFLGSSSKRVFRRHDLDGDKRRMRENIFGRLA
jgi:hypothetical protein